jgi:hypothetical protein
MYLLGDATAPDKLTVLVLSDEVFHTTALVERVVAAAVGAWGWWALGTLGICRVAVDRGHIAKNAFWLRARRAAVPGCARRCPRPHAGRRAHARQGGSSRWNVTLHVGPVTLHVGTVTLHVGSVTLHVGPVTLQGTVTLHVGTVTLHVGTVTLHVGPVTLHVGPVTLHVGTVTLHVGTVTLHVGTVTLHVGTMHIAAELLDRLGRRLRRLRQRTTMVVGPCNFPVHHFACCGNSASLLLPGCQEL